MGHPVFAQPKSLKGFSVIWLHTYLFSSLFYQTATAVDTDDVKEVANKVLNGTKDALNTVKDVGKDALDTAKDAGNTGKSFSEALILASVNSQYDNRLFIELQVQ